MKPNLKIVLLLSLVAGACSHNLDGPTPVVSMLAPSTVCNAHDTVVTISGSSFAPVPEKVLSSTATLILPTVSLIDSAGMTHAIDPIDMQWTNQTTIKMTVHAVLALTPGAYDVVVTNPTGKSGKLAGGLTVVPPPTISSLSPPAVWNGTDNTVTIVGTNFRMTPTVAIALSGGTPIMLTATFVDAQHVTVVVPKGTPKGSYTLTLTNPEGCTASATLIVTDVQTLAVTSIVNPFGCNCEDTPVTIVGSGFSSTPTAYLLGGGVGGTDLKLKSVAFVSSTKLTAIVPGAATNSPSKIGGAYDLRVVNPDGSIGTEPKAFTVTKLPPPSITSMSTTQVDGSFKTSSPITITGSNFVSGAQIVYVDSSGAEHSFPLEAVSYTGVPASLGLTFDASATSLTSGIYLIRVKEADAPVASGGTGVTMFADFSLFIVTNPSSKFSSAQQSKALPSGRRGLGVVGDQINSAARFLYAIGGDTGGATPTVLADGLFAPLDLFGDIGDAGWQSLRKSSSASPPVDTANHLPSALTGIGIAQQNGWVYVVGGTTTLTAGTPAMPGAPSAAVYRARILLPSDAPNADASVATGGTLAAGTYYYKVAQLVTAGTTGYGPNRAETLPSDEVVVTAAAGQKIALAITPAASVTAAIAGYRIYRSPAANGTSQSEVWLADLPASATSFTDDGSATPGSAHPLVAGMLSEWESAGTMLIPRAYPGVTLATPPGASAPNLYVIGGLSNATGPVVEKTYELASIATDGTLSTFGPAGLAPGNANNCTTESCMTLPRWALYTSTVDAPPAVTSDVYLLAGAGAPAGTMGSANVQERAVVNTNGTLGTWASVAISGGGGFTASPTTLGAIGIYNNGFIALVNGYSGNVSNQDEFGTEACSGSLMSGACPSGTDFAQTAKSASGLNTIMPIAWPGYTMTSGYLFIVGGSTDGSNATTLVQQGAQ